MPLFLRRLSLKCCFQEMQGRHQQEKCRVGLKRLRLRIHPLREALLNHPIYLDMQGSQALRIFMEHHVFAVWDFMSLLKSMQQRLCCNSVPWIPTGRGAVSRLVNEIVLGEETDEDGGGGYSSHFELYHRAMTRFGADTSEIDLFLCVLREGQVVQESLRIADVSEPIRRFVQHTFEIIDSRDICRIASAFTFGREDLLPDVFQRIIDELSGKGDGSLDEFKYYLARHVELDADEHGPMTARLMEILCGQDEHNWRAAEEAAVGSLQARLVLWDAIHERLKA